MTWIVLGIIVVAALGMRAAMPIAKMGSDALEDEAEEPPRPSAW